MANRRKPPPLPAHWLTVEEAAPLLNLALATLIRHCSKRQVGHVAVRGSGRFLVPARCVAECRQRWCRSRGGVRVRQPAAPLPEYRLAADGTAPTLQPADGWRRVRPALTYRPAVGSTLAPETALASVPVPELASRRGRGVLL